MRARVGVVLALGLWLGPFAAWSQTAGAAPPSPAEIATARALADRLIAEAGAAEAFENVTTTGMARVRHRLSGTQCIFTGKGDRLSLETGFHIQLHGYRCDTTLDGAAIQWIVLDLPMRPQLALDAAASALKDNVPDLAASRQKFADMAAMGADDKPLMPPSITKRFEGTRDGRAVFIRLQSISWSGWNGSLQTIAPKGDDMRTDILAGMTFLNLMSGANGLSAGAGK